jgi:hypothetical protein
MATDGVAVRGDRFGGPCRDLAAVLMPPALGSHLVQDRPAAAPRVRASNVQLVARSVRASRNCLARVRGGSSTVLAAVSQQVSQSILEVQARCVSPVGGFKEQIVDVRETCSDDGRAIWLGRSWPVGTSPPGLGAAGAGASGWVLRGDIAEASAQLRDEVREKPDSQHPAASASAPVTSASAEIATNLGVRPAARLATAAADSAAAGAIAPAARCVKDPNAAYNTSATGAAHNR